MTVERRAAQSDADLLIKRAKRGDRRAFDILVEEHRGRVRSYCVRLLKNEPEGEQAAQDAFAQAWTQLAGFGLKSPFSSWLMQIACNVCLNIIRTKKGRDAVGGRKLDADEFDARLSPEPEFADAVIGDVYAQHLLEMIWECEKTAKPRWDALDVMIFHLRFEQGIETAREVAGRLGKSENTVKDRLYKRINPVLKSVRRQLEAEETSF